MNKELQKCEDCLRYKNSNGSECRLISERSERAINCRLIDLDPCPLWEAKPNWYYEAEGKKGLFRTFPYCPTNTKEYDEEIKNGAALVKVKDIVKAYMKLNEVKSSVIIFYMLKGGEPKSYIVLKPKALANRKEITKLVKGVIPMVDVISILDSDLWYKLEEEFDRAEASPPYLAPHDPPPSAPQFPHNDRDATDNEKDPFQF